MPNQRKLWALSRNARIEPVLRWCLTHHQVDRLMVSARMKQRAQKPTLAEPSVGEAIDRLFGSYILSRNYTSEWPGTRLTGHDGLVVTVRFSETLIDTMTVAGESFRDWTARHSPPLPEDLCLYRLGDDQPTLLSVTYEDEAWLYTDQNVDLSGASPVESSVMGLIPPAANGFVGPSLGSSYPTRKK